MRDHDSSSHKHVSIHKKRDDIQGLRGIAIAAVLSFHLHPTIFVNGFLGVDVFFVLSGYLMSSILSKELVIMSWRTISTFYQRRFKRIVPLYAIALLAVTIVTPYVFIPVDTLVYTDDAYWALGFATNMKDIIRRADYWRGVFNHPLLLHTWSLGVEIQYYLFAPFIVALSRTFRQGRIRIAFLSVLILCSLAVHISSRNTISFGFLFARTWQFWIGACSYELHSAHKYEEAAEERGMEKERLIEGGEHKASRESRRFVCSPPLVCSLILLLHLFAPFTIIDTITPRISSTLLTGYLLFCGHFQESALLSFKPVVYLGDLSYVTYLLHWPIIIFTKYQLDILELVPTQTLPCLAFILFLSVLVHEYLEKCLLRVSLSRALLIVVTAYGLILGLLLSGTIQEISECAVNVDSSRDFSDYSPKVVRDAMRFNTDAAEDMKRKDVAGMKLDTQLMEWADYTGEGARTAHYFPHIVKGNGTTRILIVGNSYSFKTYQMVASIFNGRYKELRRMGVSGCKLISSADCGDFRGSSMRVIDKMRPDLLFIVSRDLDMVRESINGSLANDTIYCNLDEYIRYATSRSGLVVLQTQHYAPHGDMAREIVKRLHKGYYNFTDLSIAFKDYQAAYRNEITRIDALNYKNLFINRAQEQLCDDVEGFCRFYNSSNLRSIYADAAAHLSREGLSRQFPFYSAIIEDFLREFDPAAALVTRSSKDIANAFPFVEKRAAKT